jgi:hypothetical protein
MYEFRRCVMSVMRWIKSVRSNLVGSKVRMNDNGLVGEIKGEMSSGLFIVEVENEYGRKDEWIVSNDEMRILSEVK